MKKVGATLSLAIMLVAGSASGQCPCAQISRSKLSEGKAEIKRNMACPEFSERMGGLLVHIECVPDCGLDYGYYLSRDDGHTWTGISKPDLDEGETDVRTFGRGRTQDKVRYRAIASGQGDRKQWLLERSNDYGKAWAKKRAIWTATGLKISWFADVYYDNANPEVLYATVLLGKVGDKWQLFISRDGGDTFTLLARDIYDFSVSQTTPRVIYAITFVNSIIKSVDNGRTWSEVGQISLSMEPSGNAKNSVLLSIQIDPSNSERVFVLSFNGLFRSQDGGATWCRVDLGIARQVEACNFVIDPQDAKRMYLGTYDKGMFKSEDGGCNWEAVDLPAER